MPGAPPPTTRRLFAHYEPSALTERAALHFVVLRLAEEGDRDDLRWLVGRCGGERIADVLSRRGRRHLSRRSRAFWEVVFGLDVRGAGSSDSEPWPR